MGLLSRESILASEDLPRELLSVPEWGGDVWVRTLTGAERDAFEASNVRVTGKGRNVKREPNVANFRARLAVLVCCDEQGKRLFADADAAALGRKSSAALDRIADVALRLNGMTEEAAEEAEGNSQSAPSGASISPSPGSSAAPSGNCSPASAPTS